MNLASNLAVVSIAQSKHPHRTILEALPIELAHSSSIARRQYDPRPASRSRSRNVSQNRSLLHRMQPPLPTDLQSLHQDNRRAHDEGLVAVLADERGPVQGVQRTSFGEEKQRGVVSDLRLGSEREAEADRGRQGWLSSGSWLVMARAELCSLRPWSFFLRRSLYS